MELLALIHGPVVDWRLNTKGFPFIGKVQILHEILLGQDISQSFFSQRHTNCKTCNMQNHLNAVRLQRNNNYHNDAVYYKDNLKNFDLLSIGEITHLLYATNY